MQVQINTTEFLKIPFVLDSLLEKVNQISVILAEKQTKYIIDKSNPFNSLGNSTVFQLEDTLELINDHLSLAKTWFPNQTRVKRNAAFISGLFGIVGLGSSLASHYRISNAWAAIEENRENIKKIQWETNLQSIKINELISDLNLVKDSLTQVTEGLSDVFQYLNLFIVLERVQDKSRDLVNYIKGNVDTIIAAAEGTVSPAVISLNQLKSVLSPVDTLGFKPIFTNDLLSFYYTIIEVSIDDLYIYLNIPLALNEQYSHFIVHPFPTVLNNKVIKLDIAKTHVILSDEQEEYIITDNLEHCSNSPTVFVCQKRKFISYLVRENENCLVSVVQNQTTHSCVFQELAPTSIISLSLDEITYIYIDEPTSLILDCGSNQRVVQIKGVHSFPSTCTLKSEYLHIAGLQTVARTLHSHRLHLKPETLNLPKERVEKIFNALQELPPIYIMSSKVHNLTTIISVSLCCIFIFFILIGFFVRYRRMLYICTHRQRLCLLKDQATLAREKKCDEKVDPNGHSIDRPNGPSPRLLFS